MGRWWVAETHGPKGAAPLGCPAEVPTRDTQPKPLAAIRTDLYLVGLPAVGSSGLPTRTAMFRGSQSTSALRPISQGREQLRCGSGGVLGDPGARCGRGPGICLGPPDASGPRAALGTFAQDGGRAGVSAGCSWKARTETGVRPPSPHSCGGLCASPESPPQTAWRAGARWSSPYTVL